MPLPQVDEMSILKIVNFYNKWIDLDVIVFQQKKKRFRCDKKINKKWIYCKLFFSDCFSQKLYPIKK